MSCHQDLELNFCKRIKCSGQETCVTTNSIKNAIVESRQSRDFKPGLQGNQNIYNPHFDVCSKNSIRSCYPEDFMKKYWKLPEICSKNLENHKFSFTPVEERSRESSLGPPEPCNCFKKLDDRISSARSKNHSHNLLIGGGVSKPPDAINRTGTYNFEFKEFVTCSFWKFEHLKHCKHFIHVI